MQVARPAQLVFLSPLGGGLQLPLWQPVCQYNFTASLAGLELRYQEVMPATKVYHILNLKH